MEWNHIQKVKLLAGSLIIIGVVFLGCKYLFPLLSPFVIAYGVALVIEKPVNALSRLFGGRKGVAATIIVILLTMVLLGVFGYLVYLGVSEIRSFIQNFNYYLIVVEQKTAHICMDMDGFLGLKNGCCMDFICNCIEKCTGSWTDDSSSMMTRVVSISFPALLRISLVIGGIIVSLMSIVYLANRLEPIREWRQTTIFRQEAAAVTDALKRLFVVYFKIQLIIMGINAAVCMVGMFFLKNPYAVVIGLLIGFVDALPFFGTGTVLIPWAVISILLRDFKGAAILIMIYLITYFVREIMESKCMGDKMGISPFVLLMVIFVGILVYGILGFILGPISYVIIKALVDYLKTVIERGKLVT